MAKRSKPVTNITPAMQSAFDALASGKYNNFALFSCFVDGKPVGAIVTVDRDESGEFIITPLFISVAPGMVLADHNGDVA